MDLEILSKKLNENKVISSSGCWIWTGGKSNGYGRIYIGDSRKNNKSITAHRISWLIYRGNIPEGLFVCHKCDVRSCFNPSHLFLGTPKENNQDAVKKGRFIRGERAPRSKLSHEKVSLIKEMISAGLKQANVAKAFGVCPSSISRIVSGESWKYHH